MRPGADRGRSPPPPGVVPYFDLSFQHAAPRCCAGCAASATPTLPRAARADPREGARGRRPIQLHRRLPRRDRGRRRGARGFLTRPGSTRSACSATPTRTAPRPRRCDGKLDQARSPTASSGSPPSPRSSPPSAPRTGSASASRSWSRTAATRAAWPGRRPPGPRGRRRTTLLAASPAASARRPRPRAVVVGTEGVDLVAAPVRGLAGR